MHKCCKIAKFDVMFFIKCMLYNFIYYIKTYFWRYLSADTYLMVYSFLFHTSFFICNPSKGFWQQKNTIFWWRTDLNRNLMRVSKCNLYLVHCIKPPNHESCFLQFFPRIFLSFSSWKRKQFFYWSKQVFSHFWTNEKFVLFFNCSTWKKFVEKIGGNKIRGMVVWSYEQDT